MSRRNADESTVRPPAVAVAREWPDVHVEYVELSVEPGESGPGRAHVQACVGLGDRLLPADVRVELVTSVDGRTGASPVRLWSTRSYHNGSYLFEADAPVERLSRSGDLSVSVVPTSGTAGVEPVIVEIDWPHSPPASH